MPPPAPTLAQKILSLLLATFMRAVSSTLRIKFRDTEGVSGHGPEQIPPLVWVFWHNRILIVPTIYNRFYRERRSAAMTSLSRDGTLLAQILARFGIRASQGSSSRGGAEALIRMVRLTREGLDVGITPDGPRGPLYTIAPGIVRLAQKIDRPIFPIHVEYHSCWRLRSWDRFMIPKPFSTVEVTCGPFFHVQPTSTPEEFEAERARLEETLRLARRQD